MADPVWDGQGVDPWMPRRLAAQTEAVVGERTVFDDYLARLSRWLVDTRRAVMRSPVTDPDAIWSLMPAWAESMTEFVHTAIADLIGVAYRKLLGPGYLYGQRPHVTAYLAEAQNRLVNVPNQVYDKIVGQIAEGAGMGEGMPQIARRVDGVFSLTDTPYWRNRSTVVARTEALGALNAGRAGAFQAVAAELGEPFEQGWLATHDLKTRPTHRAADIGTPIAGQRVPVGTPFLVGGFWLDQPGDPKGPAQEVIQCVPGDTLVSFPGLRAVTRRWYEGDLVKIRFASGDELSITPNHPILRADGVWTPAGLLNEGDHCIRAAGGGESAGAPDEDGGPAEISEVCRAAEVNGSTEWVVLSPPDLHGDGSHGQIEVIAVDRGLSADHTAATDEQVEQFGLTLADAIRFSQGNVDRSLLASDPAGDGLATDVPDACGLRHGASQLAPSDLAQLVKAQEMGGLLAAHPKPQLTQATRDGGAADPQRSGDRENALTTLMPGLQIAKVDLDAPNAASLLQTAQGSGREQPPLDGPGGQPQRSREGGHALAGVITTTQVVKIEQVAFAGHVYNLDTGEGWYSANSIICRNCRCTTVLLRPGENIDLSDRQMVR